MLGDLSARYESNGDPATVSSGYGDGGGMSYGAYQFASNFGVPQKFVEWVQGYADDALANYGRVLAQYEVNSQAFIQSWVELGTVDPVGFLQLQHDYTKECYFDSGASNLLDWYGFDIADRTEALQNVLWSACVQFGDTYGAVNFKEAADMLGKDMNDCTDEELVTYVYEVRLNDLSYSSGSPSLRPGLFARWRSEREDALAMLSQET